MLILAWSPPQAVELNPKFALAHFNRGVMLGGQARHIPYTALNNTESAYHAECTCYEVLFNVKCPMGSALYAKVSFYLVS